MLPRRASKATWSVGTGEERRTKISQHGNEQHSVEIICNPCAQKHTSIARSKYGILGRGGH
jgi:hypothetical protein